MSFQELRLESLATLLRAEANGLLKHVNPAHAAYDQFDRAIESAKCNINEARGQTTPKRKVFFYGIARGSADEARGCANSFVQSRSVTAKMAYRMIGLLIVTAKMISSLIEVIEQEGTVKPT